MTQKLAIFRAEKLGCKNFFAVKITSCPDPNDKKDSARNQNVELCGTYPEPNNKKDNRSNGWGSI